MDAYGPLERRVQIRGLAQLVVDRLDRAQESLQLGFGSRGHGLGRCQCLFDGSEERFDPLQGTDQSRVSDLDLPLPPPHDARSAVGAGQGRLDQVVTHFGDGSPVEIVEFGHGTKGVDVRRRRQSATTEVNLHSIEDLPRDVLRIDLRAG